MGKKSKVKSESVKVVNYRELVEKRYETFGEDIAFKYKEKSEIKEISYQQFVQDIKAIAEVILDSDVKRVAVIGNNRYEWCVTYLGVTTAGRVIVPLDKALTDKEIEKLLKRSGADAVVYEEKYEKAVKREGFDEGYDKGLNAERKNGIRQLISALREMQADHPISDEEITQKLMSKYSLTLEETENFLKQYGK